MAPGRDKKLRYFLVFGCKWNNIRTVTVSSSSSKVIMTNSHYAIQLLVVEADENGVEIDKCLLQFKCSHALHDVNECPLDSINADNCKRELSAGSYNTGDIGEGSPPSISTSYFDGNVKHNESKKHN